MSLAPQEVLPTLTKHLLVDGYRDIVVDLRKSQGSYIYDSLKGKRFLDLFSYFASAPIGHNHPGMLDDKVKTDLLEAAIGKPSNSDFYTTQMAEFVQVFSEHAVPVALPNVFFVSGHFY